MFNTILGLAMIGATFLVILYLGGFLLSIVAFGVSLLFGSICWLFEKIKKLWQEN